MKIFWISAEHFLGLYGSYSLLTRSDTCFSVTTHCWRGRNDLAFTLRRRLVGHNGTRNLVYAVLQFLERGRRQPPRCFLFHARERLEGESLREVDFSSRGAMIVVIMTILRLLNQRYNKDAPTQLIHLHALSLLFTLLTLFFEILARIQYAAVNLHFSTDRKKAQMPSHRTHHLWAHVQSRLGQ